MAAQTLPFQPSSVLITLARLAAKEAVKQSLRDQGLRTHHFRASEIGRAQMPTSTPMGGPWWRRLGRSARALRG